MSNPAEQRCWNASGLRRRVGLYAGTAGLFLFALSGGFSVAAMNVGAGLLLIGLLLHGREAFPALVRDPLVLAILGLVAYVAVRESVSLLASERHPGEPWEQAWDLIRASGLLGGLVAWWFTIRPAWRYRVLVLALVSGFAGFGIALGEAPYLPWEQFVRLEIYGSPNAFGTYFALIVLGLITLAPCLRATRRGTHRWFSVGFWLATTMLALWALLWSGSRSAWLGALLGVITVVLIQSPPYLQRAWRHHRLAVVISAFAFLATAATLASAAWSTITWRLDPQSAEQSVAYALSGDWSAISDNSLRMRLLLWEGAIEAIQDKPWFGWGPAGVPAAISDYAPPVARDFPHVHNLILNLWLQLGTVGILMVIACGVLATGRAARLWRRRALPCELIVLAWAGLLTFLIINQLQIRYVDVTGIVPNALFLGFLITGHLRDGLRQNAETACGRSV